MVAAEAGGRASAPDAGVGEFDFERRFSPFARRLRAAGQPEALQAVFARHYRALLDGADGFIREREIMPVAGLPDAAGLGAEMRAAGEAALGKTVLLKLNGGLGTSMGLERAKSLLVVKDGLTFLDIIARQALSAGVPLLLMNSPATRAGSLARLRAYPELGRFGLPLDFLQHRVPKVCRDNLEPVVWPEQPELEWCPPGHGDIYLALLTSGRLAALRENGFRYAFVSNADNLGAVLDTAILGFFVRSGAPLLMEVVDRTPADRKGGHLARRRSDGGLLLREAAQCPAEEQEFFQDVERYRYFNTNSLWLDLAALDDFLAGGRRLPELPLIVNRKPVDPRQPDSTPVYQLESAMGAAIGLFPGAVAIRVPRTRFAPVKTTDDLLVARSDAWRLNPDCTLTPVTEPPPLVELDPRFFSLVDEFERRFPAGSPSLSACRRLVVEGDIVFGAGVAFRGRVGLKNTGNGPAVLPAGLEIAASDGSP